MHYFKKNIGNYAKKAGRLSMLQHGSYTLLADACYDREQFPTLEEAIEWTWASTTEEIEAVNFVLRKFFVLTDGRYVETDIQADLAEYHAKAETNKRIANERETKRKEKSTNRAPLVDEAPPNYKPLTTNKEPKVKSLSELSPDEPIASEAVEDRRKQKRLPSPEDESSARKLFGMILAVNASAKPPGSWGPWSDDIRLMREVDGRSHSEIEALFTWAKRDTFWSPNIQSPGKLREKWNTLTEQSKRPASPVRGAPVINEKFNFGHLDRSGDQRAAEATIRKHNITVPEGDEEIEI